MQEELLNQAYEDFHKLWGKAKDQPNYDKAEWTRLYTSLMQLIRIKPFKL